MKLEKFRVTNFRSIKDSGWLNIEDVVSFIGENESGKTNLLIPLWKLNPASDSLDSKLDLIKDYPRQHYHEIEGADKTSELKKQRFIVARFAIDEKDKEELFKITGRNLEIDSIEFSRDYNNETQVCLLNNEKDVLNIENAKIISKIESNISKLPNGELKDKISILFNSKKINEISIVISQEQDKDESIENLDNEINELKVFEEIKCSMNKIQAMLPRFIYYSTYENLDSEIYLPDIVTESPQFKKKRRTINTLFKFVNLSPQQIRDLGSTTNPISDDDKRRIQENTNKRQILLESASDDFTQKFNDWWKQETEYKFKFEADGQTFRIKVADNIRPSYLELSSRSSGLQWFFSFFLVFLVESQGLHKNAILLLDEPGVTLHPNAQKQLYLFFDNLAKNNQLLYTTHSPFMINSNHLDKVFAVYVDQEGHTCVSPDLRASGKNRKLENSIYPAHAALGLSVSDTLLHGCFPVIVEGVSDQIYMSLLKNSMINNGKLKTQREIVFIPSNGVKGIKSVLQILSGLQNENYPYVIVDGDTAGKDLVKNLTCKGGLYCGKDDRIFSLDAIFDGAEIEDLLPRKEIISTINNYIPKTSDCDDTFEDVSKDKEPICDQIAKYTAEHDIQLPVGYKVEIAELFKKRTNNKQWDLYNLMTDSQKEITDGIFHRILTK